MEIHKPLPFVIDRDRPEPLTQQIADGVQRAIRSGYYTVGERLPGLDEIAESMAVGRQTAQGAVRELVNRGDVVARRKAGIRVRQTDGLVFTHQVLHLRCGGGSYFFNLTNNRIAARMLQAQVQVLAIDLTREEGEAGLPHVRAALRGNAIGLALVGGHGDLMGALCQQHGVPYISYGAREVDRRALASVLMDDTAALAALAAHARGCGVRRLAVVERSCTAEFERLQGLMAAAGVSAERLSAPWSDDRQGAPEAVERAGFDCVQAYLDSGVPLPDQFHFVDDYLARGGIAALAWAGVRVPADVRISSHSNRGHTPVLSGQLTRIETSPEALADGMAALVIAQLQQARPLDAPLVVSPEFIVGDSA